ncbi:hypothetical protein ACWV95_03955 [Streptomyces albus]
MPSTTSVCWKSENRRIHHGRKAQMQVLVVSPPNSNTVIDGSSCTVTNPEEHTDWSDFPNLGILTLVSALRDVPGVEPVYIDGTVVPWPDVLKYVEDNAADILALCVRP